MFREIWERLARLGRSEPDPDDPSTYRRSVDNLDAETAARTEHEFDPTGSVGGIPPDYVKEYDEGRPPH
jgi:hypothetical protein